MTRPCVYCRRPATATLVWERIGPPTEGPFQDDYCSDHIDQGTANVRAARTCRVIGLTDPQTLI